MFSLQEPRSHSQGVIPEKVLNLDDTVTVKSKKDLMAKNMFKLNYPNRECPQGFANYRQTPKMDYMLFASVIKKINKIMIIK